MFLAKKRRIYVRSPTPETGTLKNFASKTNPQEPDDGGEVPHLAPPQGMKEKSLMKDQLSYFLQAPPIAPMGRSTPVIPAVPECSWGKKKKTVGNH